MHTIYRYAVALGVAGSVVVLSAGMTLAVTVNVPGESINVDNSGATVQYQGGGTTSVQTGAGSVKVTTPGQTTTVSGQNVTNTQAGGTVNVNASDLNNISVTVPGENVQIKGSNGTLSVQVSHGDLDPAAKSAVVSLQGNSDMLITSSADVSSYNQLVVQTRPAVQSINISGNSVDVVYHQPAKLLGFISTTLNGTATVDASGNVVVKLPWYSFLYSTQANTVKTKISSDLSTATSNGSVNLQVWSQGANSSVTYQNQARVINIVTADVNGSSSVSVSQ